MFVADPRASYERALAAALALLAAFAAVGGALAIEHLLGVRPCHLCLLERWPYYVGILICCVAVGTAHKGRMPSEVALGVAAAVFAGGAAFGIYHSGVESGLWAGPESCTGAVLPPAPASADAFFRDLQGTPPTVRCDAVSYRLLGLSLANWNVVASAAIALVCLAGIVPALRRHLPRLLGGSSSPKA